MAEQKTRVQAQEEKERLFLEARSVVLNRVVYELERQLNHGYRTAIVEATDVFAKYGFDVDDVMPSVVVWLERNDYTAVDWFIVEEQKCGRGERITALELVKCLFTEYCSERTVSDVLEVMGLYALVISMWKTGVVIYRTVQERDLEGE